MLRFTFKFWHPCRDSNPGTRFRKPLLYPLSYRGKSDIIILTINVADDKLVCLFQLDSLV